MTVILLTEDVGSRGEDIAAGAAASLGLELVTMQQLELLVAMHMRTRQERLHRLITGRASLLVLERWTAHGGTVAFGPLTIREGVRTALLVDPDGNTVEAMHDEAMA